MHFLYQTRLVVSSQASEHFPFESSPSTDLLKSYGINYFIRLILYIFLKGNTDKRDSYLPIISLFILKMVWIVRNENYFLSFFHILRVSSSRYDSSQCVSLQQPLGPPRVPPQGMYGYMDEQERYQQEAAAQQHQIAVANAQSLMKPEEQEPSGPLYPRCVRDNYIITVGHSQWTSQVYWF